MTTDRLRRLMLGILALGLLGTGTELLLLGHFETWRQWLPLALLALGAASVVGVASRPVRRTVLSLRVVAVAFLLSAPLGVYFHLASNYEFELERDATAHGVRLFWQSLTGALPALAPGAMFLLGLLGLAITAGHPALSAKE